MYEKFTITTILEAVTPIAHHSRSFGNSSIVMDEPIIQPDGSIEKVPVVTGDTMRHGMREAAAHAFLDAAGLLGERCLSEAALRLIYSGGQLSGPSGPSVSIAAYRDMLELLPSLALLGGCVNNRMMHGRMVAGRALLICEQSMPVIRHDQWTSEWLVEDVRGDHELDARSAVDLVQRVRMDPTMHPVHGRMLSEGASEAVAQRMLASEAASDAGDAVAAHAAKSSMMPRKHEVVIAGTRWVWPVTVELLSELDRDTFDLMLMNWLSDMIVGGKKGTGHGHMVPIAMSKRMLLRPTTSTAMALQGQDGVGDHFRQHVHSRRDAIKDFLATVVA